jgi:alpha-tubulin suppressor-like RCC1 family protein
VQCWGDNSSGQLGNDSVIAQSSLAVPALGLGSGVQAVVAGNLHACALVNGGVQCWGDNAGGQLGNGSDAGSYVPAAVTGLGAPGSGVQALAAGSAHTCAIVNGGVQCWGDNSVGQLGNGSDAGSGVPVAVPALESGVQALVAAQAHTCAVMNGSVWCWGDDANGDLGNHSANPSRVPVAVQKLSGTDGGVQALATGEFDTCALVNGGVQCWGNNSSGQLGNNSTTDSPLPVAVQGLASGVQAIAAGAFHTCALANGIVLCWGDDQFGELGNGSTTQSNVPLPVSPWAP